MGQYVINSTYENVENVLRKELEKGYVYESYIPVVNGLILVFSTETKLEKEIKPKAETKPEFDFFSQIGYTENSGTDSTEEKYIEDSEILLFSRLKGKTYGEIKGTELEEYLLDGIKNAPSLSFPNDSHKQEQLERLRKLI